MHDPQTQAVTARLDDIARLPSPGDNAAIAIRRLAPGTRCTFEGAEIALSHTVLEGHRFAVRGILAGDSLLSWGLPFGKALRDIRPGEYVCNRNVLDALALRRLDFRLPQLPNFADQPHGYDLDTGGFGIGSQIDAHPEPARFMGFPRAGGRGCGTRNYVVVLGTSSRTASLARALEARLKAAAESFANVDGVVAVAHTEGAGETHPNNRELVLRTLAGFMVHPNVGAVLALDLGSEAVTNSDLRDWLRTNDYPIAHLPHHFHSACRDLASELRTGEEALRGLVEAANRARRELRPLSDLRVALQCGGSDAFSGISGNPLAAWVARELIRHGGAAGLAETDELIGAEPYMLANTRDRATAEAFLQRIESFRERIAWHGHSAEGNPTGGNLYRGLYNITLKSIGAARKKDPAVRLDHVIGYGERMREPGFYFMDSPGNDLESIAGQVASGCNLIFFITGNGSITNFPFVPTVKFVTTTRRWDLLRHEMDVNAGRYLDGEPMDVLGSEALARVLDIAAGSRSAGERAAHAQVSIWRDWHRSGADAPRELTRAEPSGKPIHVRRAKPPDLRFPARRTEGGLACDRIGLVMPTSLCSGQIALRIARRLEERLLPAFPDLQGFVALAHTEGCGVSGGENEALYLRTVNGHLQHPAVVHALLLEHGCEKTHNDLMRHALNRQGVDPERFGYASIQLDGGIERVSDKVERWFRARLEEAPAPVICEAGLDALPLGLLVAGRIEPFAAHILALLAASLVAGGGTVVIPEHSTLEDARDFWSALGLEEQPEPSLAYAERFRHSGFHVMACPTRHPVETLSGLGATGVQRLLAYSDGPPMQGHPMIATLQIAPGGPAEMFAADFDLILPRGGEPGEVIEELFRLLRDSAAGTYRPRLWRAGYTDFQLTRGLSGVSL